MIVVGIRGEGQEIVKFKANFDVTTFKQEDNVDEKMEDVKEEEEKVDIEDMDLTTDPVRSQEDLSTVIPHIDFIFGDERQVCRDCDLIVQILQLKFWEVQSHVHTESVHQKKRCATPISKWRKRSHTNFKLCAEATIQPMDWNFIRSIFFNLSRHLPNSRSSSFQARENDEDRPQATCVGPKLI